MAKKKKADVPPDSEERAKDEAIAHEFYIEIESAIKTVIQRHKQVKGRIIILPLLFHVLNCFTIAGIPNDIVQKEIEEFFKAHAKISKE